MKCALCGSACMCNLDHDAHSVSGDLTQIKSEDTSCFLFLEVLKTIWM